MSRDNRLSQRLTVERSMSRRSASCSWLKPIVLRRSASRSRLTAIRTSCSCATCRQLLRHVSGLVRQLCGALALVVRAHMASAPGRHARLSMLVAHEITRRTCKDRVCVSCGTVWPCEHAEQAVHNLALL